MGRESGGALRFHERLTYTYDPAGNMTQRQNYYLMQTFPVQPGSWNRLASAGHNGQITVSGMTLGPVTSLSVNGNVITPYTDGTFAAASLGVASTYAVTAQGTAGNFTSDQVSVSLGSSASFGYDNNGNLTSDGVRALHYDDADQLIRVDVSGQGWVEYVYDPLGRRRLRKDFNSSGQFVGEIRVTTATAART